MDRGGTITWILDADDAAFLRSMLRAREESRRTARVVNRNLKDTDSELEKLRKKISITANVARDFQTVMMGFNMTSFIAGAVAAGAAVVELGGAVIAASGSVLALPGIFATVAGSAVTTRVALVGLEDAFKAVLANDPEKLAEAMKKLSPAAREFVSAFDKVNDAFKPVQQAVQQRFFEGLGKEMLATAQVSMPVLRKGMEDVAIATNGLLREVGRVSREPFFQGFIAKVLESTATSTKTLTGAVEPLTVALTGLVNVGLPYANMLSDWIVKQSQVAAAYVSSAKGQEQLTNVINIGLDALGKIFELAGALSGVLVSLFKLSNQEGLSFIGTVTEALNKFNEFLKSAEGQEKFSTLFKVANEILAESIEVIARVGRVILDLFDAIDKLPGPMREFVINLAASGIVMAPIIGYLTTLGVSLKALFLSIGTGVRGVLTLVNGLRAMAVAFGLAQAGATAISGGVFAQLGVMFSNLFNVMRTVWTFITANFIPALLNMGRAFLVAIGPVGWIIGIITLLVGAFIYLYNNVEWFRNFWDGVWKGIQDIAQDVVNWFTGSVVPFFQDMWNGIQEGATNFAQFWVDVWNGFTGIVTTVWNTITSTIANVWNGIVSAVTTGVTNVLNFLQPLFNVINGIIYVITALGTIVWTVFSTIAQVVAIVVSTLVQIIGVALVGSLMWLWNNVLVPLGQAFAEIWNGILTAVTNAVTGIVNFIVPIFQSILNTIVSVVNTIWNTITAVFTGIYNTIVSVLTTIFNFYVAVWTNILNFILPILKSIWDFVVNTFNGIMNTISSVLGTIWSVVSSTWNNIYNAVSNAVNNIFNAVRNTWNNVVNTVRNGITDAYNTVTGFVGRFLEAGKNIIDGIVRGVQQGSKKVIDTVTNIAKGALDAVKSFFGIKSPSRVMASMGNYMMEGLENGIVKTGKSVMKATESIAQGIYDSFGVIDGQSVTASVNGNISGDPILAPANIGTQDMPSQSGASNGVQVNQYNTVNTPIDMDQVIRDMTWELGRA